MSDRSAPVRDRAPTRAVAALDATHARSPSRANGTPAPEVPAHPAKRSMSSREPLYSAVLNSGT